MNWQKRGLICNSGTFDLPWFKKNAMVPLPYLISDNRLRIFLTMCDAENIGRIGYVDVDPMDPSRILAYSEEPVLNIGEDGSFSDSGIVSASLLEEDGRLYMYYSGYQACQKVPYLIFPGVAVSTDRGSSFTKLSHSPILDRVEGELFVRSSPMVIRDGDYYCVWYTSDARDGWIGATGNTRPCYDMKLIKTRSPVDWFRIRGTTCIPLQGDDEFGIAKGTIWKESGLYKVIYSIRTLSKGYRLGYAESRDGKNFVRKDDQVGIDVSGSGWDSDMIAFPERFSYHNRTYLFYCGNHYGMGGVGYAELITP